MTRPPSVPIRGSYHPASMLLKLPHVTYAEFHTQYSEAEATKRPNSFIEAHATHVHEYLHFMQAIGTAFGRFETIFRVYQLYVLRTVLRFIGSDSPTNWTMRPYLPLCDWCRKCPDFHSRAPKNVQHDWERWEQIETLLALLRGDTEPTDRTNAICLELLGVLPTKQPMIACDKGHQHALGAHVIMEASAEFAEYCARMSMRPLAVMRGISEDMLTQIHTECDIDHVDWTFEGVQVKWSPASYYPLNQCVTLAPEHFLATELSHLDKHQRMWLLPVICDLALATPPSTSMRDLKAQQRTTWNDIHPGHRFLAIVEYLKTCKARDKRLTHPTQVGTFSELVGDICAKYGWLHPNDLATQVSSDVLSTPAHVYFFTQAAQLRLRNPFAFLQPYVRPHEFNVYLLLGLVPHVLFADGRRVFSPKSFETDPRLADTLRDLMMREAMDDAVFRGEGVECVYKALKSPCGLEQHAHCDDCLRDSHAAMCEVAAGAYQGRFGPHWRFIQSIGN